MSQKISEKEFLKKLLQQDKKGNSKKPMSITISYGSGARDAAKRANEWVPCIVFGVAGDIKFGLPLKTGMSVVMPPKFNVNVGDFVDIKYKKLPIDKPTDRARHITTDVRKSEQPAPNIKVKNNKVIFYTVGRVFGFDEFENKRVTLLQNDMFGPIIDLYQNLPLLEIGTIVEVECRMKESPRKKKTTILIVTDHRIPQAKVSAPNPEKLPMYIPSSNTPLTSNNSEVQVCPSQSFNDEKGEQEKIVDQTAGTVEANFVPSPTAAPKPMNKYANKTKAEMLVHIQQRCYAESIEAA